jgi:hypothetical protein
MPVGLIELLERSLSRSLPHVRPSARPSTLQSLPPSLAAEFSTSQEAGDGQEQDQQRSEGELRAGHGANNLANLRQA